ncbi:MAG TPA: class I SAM-dependent methyltransferase, partial [Bryobacteraceae bacterium]|nr:class I SAM-dependent methyltransferase [Bryobacteraceae bacterium]
MARRGRSAYGAGMVRAMERFEPADQRLFDDPVILDLLPWLARLLIRSSWVRARFAGMFDTRAPGIRGALLCRTRAIDDAVKSLVSRGMRTVV